MGGDAGSGDLREGSRTEVRLRGGMEVVSARLGFGVIVPSPVSTLASFLSRQLSPDGFLAPTSSVFAIQSGLLRCSSEAPSARSLKAQVGSVTADVNHTARGVT